MNNVFDLGKYVYVEAPVNLTASDDTSSSAELNWTGPGPLLICNYYIGISY